jgi:hypothetical protein
MTDYRDPYFDHHRPAGFDPDARTTNATWGWIAAAVFLVVILAVGLGLGHQPGHSGTNTAMNIPVQPPAMTRMNPPAFAPATPAPPIAPATNTPARSGTNQ